MYVAILVLNLFILLLLFKESTQIVILSFAFDFM